MNVYDINIDELNTIYNSDDALSGERTVTMAGYNLTFTSTTASLILESTDGGFFVTTSTTTAATLISDDSYALEAVSTNQTGIFAVGAMNGISALGDEIGVLGVSSGGTGGKFTSDNGQGVEATSTAAEAILATSPVEALHCRGAAYIETNGINGTRDASAVMEIRSTTQGFLPPRMTSTERNAISSPASGLLVYDTTLNGWFGFDGTDWQQL